MKKFRGRSFVKKNGMFFLFCPIRTFKAVILVLGVVLFGVDLHAEEIARVSGSETQESSPMVVSPAYELQLNSFKIESNAKKFFAGLVKKGYQPFIVPVQNGEAWYKIRLGPYPLKETAGQIKTELKSKHNLSSFILLSEKPRSEPEKVSKITPAIPVDPKNTGNSIDVVMSQFLVWLEAWQGKQLDSYFSFYSQSFESGGKPFKDWLKEQSNTLDEIQQIKVEINDLEMLEKGDTVEMSFMENFQSKSFSDIRRKILVWKKEKGVWKIIVESSEPA